VDESTNGDTTHERSGEMTQTMEARLTAVEKDQAEFRQVVREIRDISSRQADSLEKLVRLEERHAESREALSRAFTEIEKHDAAIHEIKIAMPPLIEMRKWLASGMIGTIAIVFIALIAMVLHSPIKG
jgi:septation ring formation regulator EzrA